MTKRKTWTRRIGFGLLLGMVAASTLLAVGAGSAIASPVATDKATGACWKEVVNDWLQNQPNVKGSYPIPCYTQAIQHLDRYPDIQQYSNAPDDIHRALLAALAAKHKSPQSSGTQGTTTTSAAATPSSSGGGGSSSKSSGTKSSGPSSSGAKSSGSTGGSANVTPASKSFVTKLFDSVGPGNAQSIPLPLLVLAGLAILLLLAAIGTWLAKRIQARRMTPAPATAPRRPPQS